MKAQTGVDPMSLHPMAGRETSHARSHSCNLQFELGAHTDEDWQCVLQHDAVYLDWQAISFTTTDHCDIFLAFHSNRGIQSQ
jgi:hypothetical protein